MTAPVQTKIARAYSALGNYGKALDFYERAFSKKKKLPITASEYGKLLYRVRRFKKADSIFLQLTNHYPNNPDLHYRLGLAKKQLGDSTATGCFQKAFLLDDSHQKAIYELMLVNLKGKNFEKTASLGQKALATYPENAEILGVLAQNAMAQRKYYLASKHFELLDSLNQASEFVHENLGLAYLHLNQLEKAVEAFQKTLAINPQNTNAYLLLGKTYNRLSKPDLAKDALEKALFFKKLGLDVIYQNLGNTYKSKKEFAKAIGYYKKALEINPYNFHSQYQLAISADNYYKDPQTRLNYYKIFIKKFKTFPNVEAYISFAKYRVGELKKEIHMNAGGN